MSITTTLQIGDDTASVLATLLNRFPKGRRIEVTFHEENPPPPRSAPTLEEYKTRVQEAQKHLVPLPWATSEEALRDLRAGEQD
jgi:hypothetical protein